MCLYYFQTQVGRKHTFRYRARDLLLRVLTPGFHPMIVGRCLPWPIPCLHLRHVEPGSLERVESSASDIRFKIFNPLF